YAAPPSAGATISWCSQTPVPVSGSVSVEYHTSRRPGWPRQRDRIKPCAGWNAGTKAPDDADDSDDANGSATGPRWRAEPTAVNGWRHRVLCEGIAPGRRLAGSGDSAWT